MPNKEKLLASAQKSLQKGQLAKAIKDYKKVIDSDPKDIRNRQKLAELCVRAKMPKEAQEHYEGVARYYSENGFFLKAIAVYKQMQRVEPSRVEIYHRLAELNAKQGLIGNALAEYKGLVSHYEKEGLLPEAINILQKMKDLDPDNLNIRVKISESYAKAGLRDKSLNEIQATVKILRQKGEIGKLLKLYDIFLPLFPEEIDLRNGYARALVDKGEVRKGMQLLEDLLQVHPTQTEILNTLAYACQISGDTKTEIRVYHQLLEQQPNDLRIREKFLRACLRRESYEEALAHLEQWKEDFFDSQRVDLLKEFYEQLREQMPQNEKVLESLRNIYQVRGEGDKLLDLMSLSSADSLATEGDEEDAEEILDAPVFEEAEQDLADESTLGPHADELEELPSEFLEESTGEDFELELELEGDPFAELAPAETPEEEGGEELDGQDLGELELIELPDIEPEIEAAGEAGPSEEPQGQELSLDELPELEFDFDKTLEVSENQGDEPTNVGRDLSPASGESLPAPDFQEIDFFLQQNMVEEAYQLGLELSRQFPGESSVDEKIKEIQSLRGKPASGLQGDMTQKEKNRLEGEFSRFKKSIQSQIDEGDAETHFNLGIAYKEMGLIDDAVNEFDQAMKNLSRRLDALTLKGICLKDKGDFEGSEEAFKAALTTPEIDKETLCNLYFELGLLQESQEQYNEALKSYEQVSANDPFFRQVNDKISSLKSHLGIKDDNSKGDDGRVSYV